MFVNSLLKILYTKYTFLSVLFFASTRCVKANKTFFGRAKNDFDNGCNARNLHYGSKIKYNTAIMTPK